MDTVLVTGFGPFERFPINSSWETAKELKKLDFESCGINLIIEEIVVAYGTVSELVPQLWEKYHPQLVVHIGVSAYAKQLTLETCARRDGYVRADVEGKLPVKCDSKNLAEFQTCFDLEEVVTQFNATNQDGVSSVLSADAGRYLCEFTYYTSLCIEPERTIFIHVPDIDRPYTPAQMAKGIREIILLLIDQVKVKCPNKT